MRELEPIVTVLSKQTKAVRGGKVEAVSYDASTSIGGPRCKKKKKKKGRQGESNANRGGPRVGNVNKKKIINKRAIKQGHWSKTPG